MENRLDRYAKPQGSNDWSEDSIIRCRNNVDDVMVTVVCITYNHELYIAEALESFVSQITNFKFLVFVGDDCSTDSTPKIVQQYAEKYPDTIVPFLREENMGGMGKRNLIDLCEHASSPYIATCEGDDYWCDPYKLQKQFDYMEEHPDYRICFCKTRIQAPEDWYFSSYYIANDDGERVIPDCKPGYRLPPAPLTAKQCIDYLPCHTSSVFYRWDYALTVPEWFYDGVIGDHPIFLLQLGMGQAGYITDIGSVYRRSEVGVAMNKSVDDDFIQTRLDYCRFLLGLREFFDENYEGYCKVNFENRIKLEVYNYLNTAIKVDDSNLILELFEEYPEAGRIALSAFLSFYRDQRSLTGQYGWEGYKMIARSKRFRKFNKRIVRTSLSLRSYKTKLKKHFSQIKKKLHNLHSLLCYKKYSLVPKDPSIWVFSCFYKHGYQDNTRYLYEYVVENHPEIKAYWTTLDTKVYNDLIDNNMPVVLMGTKQCRDITSRAAIAVTDHFRMSDYDNRYGFNANTKVVQLWHGVGFKSMGDGKTISNTDVKGVRYSDDILPQEGDSQETIKRKKRLYSRYSYNRELFEEYFMFVCPGQERIDMFAKVWHIPESSYFMAGNPRNIKLYSQEQSQEHFSILYAPTYRFDVDAEKKLVYGFLDSLDAIEETMKAINGKFEFRLHPHTWRNYKSVILHRIDEYETVYLNEENDIYDTLGTFHLVITDYSSIAMDFAMLMHPVIFYCPDYDWYVDNEAGFNIDFKNAIPGPLTCTWDDTLDQIRRYSDDPDCDLEFRRKKTSYFFDEEANGPDNSERIVQEIKRRLQIN